MRFGYKNWVICADGYTYKVLPYQGKSESNYEGPLGFKVVRELLDVRSDDLNYRDVHFDKFFISLPLLEDFSNTGNTCNRYSES